MPGDGEGDPELVLVELVGVVEVWAGVEVVVEPPSGAVLAPSIWDCSSEVNVPVAPFNLIRRLAQKKWARRGGAYVNLAEKAKAGYWGLEASLRLSDSKRMKLLTSVNQ